MAEEHEAREPYKCAVCGEKFDSQERLQEHLKKCTAKKADAGRVRTGGESLDGFEAQLLETQSAAARK